MTSHISQMRLYGLAPYAADNSFGFKLVVKWVITPQFFHISYLAMITSAMNWRWCP
jgi:hypothetical protein